MNILDLLIKDPYDLLCFLLGAIGVLLFNVMIGLNDWDIRKVIFVDEEEDTWQVEEE